MNANDTLTRLRAQGDKEIMKELDELEGIRRLLTEVSYSIIDKSISASQYKEEFIDVSSALRLSKRCLDRIIIQRRRDLLLSAKKPLGVVK